MSESKTVKIKVDERVFGAINPGMTIYVDGVKVWDGRVGETAEIQLATKSLVRAKITKVPVLSKNGEFEGEIDPDVATSYILKPYRKTFNMLHFKAYPKS